MKHTTLCALSFLLLLTAACGRGDEPGTVASELGGPPGWRLADSALSTGGTGFTLHARTPGRVRFRLEATDRISRTSPWRELAGGQTVVVAWSMREEPAKEHPEIAGPDDERAGRTEAHAALVRFEFSDRISAAERHVFFTRPGKGRVVTRDLLPPGLYEPLPLGGPIELGTLVVSDLSAGEVVVRNRELEARVLRPAGMTDGDRVYEVRLFLDVELIDE